jgi:phosphoribosylamine--glycine ligase
VAIGVVLSIPDYPYSHITRKEVTGVPVYGVTPELEPHIHPCEMMQTVAPDAETLKPAPILATAGDYVLVMTATGPTVREAKRVVYDRLKALSVPNNPMYRTDIGDRLRKQLPELQAHGYAAGMFYAAAPKPPPAEKKEDSLIVGQTKIVYV